jgi:predicted DNA-binding transcriptional regulator AlpA
MSKSIPHSAREQDAHVTTTDGVASALHHLSSDHLLTAREVCQMLGGTDRPINTATLYRGIATGRFPRPLRISPNIARWIRAEIEAVVRKAAADRAA